MSNLTDCETLQVLSEVLTLEKYGEDSDACSF